MAEFTFGNPCMVPNASEWLELILGLWGEWIPPPIAQNPKMPEFFSCTLLDWEVKDIRSGHMGCFRIPGGNALKKLKPIEIYHTFPYLWSREQRPWPDMALVKWCHSSLSCGFRGAFKFSVATLESCYLQSVAFYNLYFVRMGLASILRLIQ